MVTFVYRPQHPEADEYGHVEKSKALEWDYYQSKDSSNLQLGCNFISDMMPDTRHMVNGKIYNSKAAFRNATKAAGCIEVGNDSSYLNPKPRKPKLLDRRERRESIRQALHTAKNAPNK